MSQERRRPGDETDSGSASDPELDREENQARFIHYLEGYGSFMTPAERQETLDRFGESPEANELIPRFLKLVLG